MNKKVLSLIFFSFFLLPFFPVISFEVIDSTPSAQINNGAFDLITYLIISIIYILIMQLAVVGGDEFSFWSMIGFFVIGGLFGAKFGYESGLVFAIILSLIFISGPKKDL